MEVQRQCIIGVDFDGTCVEHDYPNVGRTVPGAVKVLKELVANGHQLILYTMRGTNTASIYKDTFNGLRDAEQWFIDNGIELYGINKNPDQHTWTNSRKIYCHIYIDDAALGCPLVRIKGKRPYVAWTEVRRLLEIQGLLVPKNEDNGS